MPLVSNLLNNWRFPPHVAWSVALIGAVSLTIGIARAAGVFDGTYNGTYALEDNHLHPTLSFTPFSLELPLNGTFAGNPIRPDKGWTIQQPQVRHS
jgi:hypothetical protein